MVNLKFLKGSFLGLLFMIFFLSYPVFYAWGGEYNIPLPAGAIEVGKNKSDIGPARLLSRIYKSSLDKDEIYAFYEEKMLDAAWKMKRKGVFLKDRKLVIIIPYPSKGKDDKTEFSISMGDMPSSKKILAAVNKKPDKVKFMPIYPGSTQILSLGLPNSSSYIYGTGDSIKDVVFFYESGMLKYGWALISRVPVTGVADKVSLLYRRKNKEVCRIKISGVSQGKDTFMPGNNLSIKNTPRIPNKTSISVDYSLYEKVSP
ncbi:MAG: hypothetical protein WCY12_05875 [Candidatus Omnitrophota bacterium]